MPVSPPLDLTASAQSHVKAAQHLKTFLNVYKSSTSQSTLTTYTNMSLIPEYVATPLKDIPQIASNLRDAFDSQKTKPIAYRLQQLRKLYWA